MSKITEVAKGLKAATYAVHHDEYNKGFITGALSAVGGTLTMIFQMKQQNRQERGHPQ